MKSKGFRLAISLWVWLAATMSGGAICAQDLTVLVIPKSADQTYWKFVHRGMDRAAKELGGVTIIWRGPEYNDDTTAQIAILTHYFNQGIDAILICPTDEHRLVAPVEEAERLGIPVFVFDSGLSGNKYHGFIGTDNYAAGRCVAEAVVKASGIKAGNVIVLRTTKESSSTDLRAEGFLDQLRVIAPRLKIVSDTWGGGSSGKDYHSALLVLHSSPNPQIIFAVNESASEGMLMALQSIGMNGKVFFWGFDASPQLLDGVADGDIQGLAVQDPDAIGYKIMMMAHDYVVNKHIPERIVHTGIILITAKNLHDPTYQRYLVP